jgi:hypothetical protein
MVLHIFIIGSLIIQEDENINEIVDLLDKPNSDSFNTPIIIENNSKSKIKKKTQNK